MAERSMAVVLKTTVPETVPGVRIPLPPPTSLRSVGIGSGPQASSGSLALTALGTNPFSYSATGLASAAVRRFPSGSLTLAALGMSYRQTEPLLGDAGVREWIQKQARSAKLTTSV